MKQKDNIMKKIFKYSFVLLTAMLSLTLASCVSEDDYAGAEMVRGMQVFFPERSANFSATEDGGFFLISVMRADTTEAAEIPLTVEAPENCDYTVPTSVKFEAGANTAEIVVTYDGSTITPGKYDTVSVSVGDPSYTTPYGSSVFTFKAGIAPFMPVEGKIKYRDDIIAPMYGGPNVEYELELEESGQADSLFRIKLPYANHAFSAALFKAGFTESEDEADLHYIDKETATQYMIIDARDPEFVYFYGEGTEDGSVRSGVTFNSGEGQMTFISYVQYYISGGNPLDVVKKAKPEIFGKFKNGVITMPKQSVLMSFDGDDGMYYANNGGKFRICMPGVKAEDFSTHFEYTGPYLGLDGSEEVYGKVYFGADVASALVTVVPEKEWKDSDKLLEAMQNEKVPVQKVTSDGAKVGFSVSGNGKYKALVAACNSEGEIQEYSDTVFAYSKLGAAEEESWTDLFTGNFTSGSNVIQGEGPLFGEFTDEGVVLSQLDGDENTLRMAPFINNKEGLFFTMSGEADAEGRIRLTIPEVGTGVETQQYGELFAADIVSYSGDEANYAAAPSYYDTETGLFHFALVYYVPEGIFGIQEEIYQPTANAARALKGWMARAKVNKKAPKIGARKPAKVSLKKTKLTRKMQSVKVFRK